jgi:heavy metal translocating P-type ATPase
MKFRSKTRLISLLKIFRLPIFVVICIAVSLVCNTMFNQQIISNTILLLAIGIGSFNLIKDTIQAILKRDLALDYIALLAITIAVVTQQYIVAAIIVLMLTGGQTLEEYGMAKAKYSLTSLSQRLPNHVYLWENNDIGTKTTIDTVTIGQAIVIRRGEVIPLDGTLLSEQGIVDESSLTGEAIPVEKSIGDIIRSGTVNSGDRIVLSVTTLDKDSSYRKIVRLVEEAQSQKAPLIRLANKYSGIFTIITLILSGAAYIISGDIHRVLAVLVIATPCPLILATPIALMGGMSSAAKQRIIIKRLSALEVLSKIQAIVFDKTGTITFGKPKVTSVDIIDREYSHEKICSIVEAIERNSLHPLAKAIVEEARTHKHTPVSASDIHEKIGEGISGIVHGKTYVLSKVPNTDRISIQLCHNHKQIAVITLEDILKTSSKNILQTLKTLGLTLYLFTGDKLSVAQQLVQTLGEHIKIEADLSPKQKRDGILKIKKSGSITAMVGDGINDAPALAAADVGMVFSNHEHTAATEAADVVFLNGNFESVLDAIHIGKYTIHIAMQSILFGIGLSVFGMLLAVFGLIPPIIGAFIQEIIDVAVIVNALRASRYVQQ